MSRSKRAPTWWASCSFRRRRGILTFERRARAGLARARARAKGGADRRRRRCAARRGGRGSAAGHAAIHGTESPARVEAVRAHVRPAGDEGVADRGEKPISTASPVMPASPIACCSTRVRRARRRGRAGSASRSTGIFWKISIPACRSCCRAASMPAMSARPCASRARPASTSPRASSARRAKKIPTRFAPSCARLALPPQSVTSPA